MGVVAPRLKDSFCDLVVLILCRVERILCELSKIRELGGFAIANYDELSSVFDKNVRRIKPRLPSIM